MLTMGDGFYFNHESGEIVKNGMLVLKLTGIKSLILNKLLIDGVNDFISKEEIIKSTWGKADLVVTSSSLTQQMYLLRKALDEVGFRNFIIMQPRIGYKVNLRKGHTIMSLLMGHINRYLRLISIIVMPMSF